MDQIIVALTAELFEETFNEVLPTKVLKDVEILIKHF